jgi:hypothetical protein
MANCIDYSKLKAIARKDHFPPPFIDPLVDWLAGYPYYCVLDGYSSYSHIPLDPNKQENATLTFAFGAFAYCHMPFESCNTPVVENLAKYYKLRACERQPLLLLVFCCHLIWFCLFCFYCVFQDMCLLFKFGRAFSYITPNLCHPFGIVFLTTFGTMSRFSLGVRKTFLSFSSCFWFEKRNVLCC